MLAPTPPDEDRRLAALQSYCVLDTPPEPVFDHLTQLGAALFRVPFVLISLVDEHRLFFKAAVGLDVTEIPRQSSFCSYTILEEEPLVVLDARTDRRFLDHALVLGDPFIRFYAGAPLVTKDGLKLGSFCIIDRHARKNFTEEEQQQLTRLAALTVGALEQRLLPFQLSAAEKTLQEAQERFRLATQAAADGIWDCDNTTGKVYYSARLRSLVGLPNQDHVGTIGEWIDRLHPDDAAAARENIRRVQSSGVPQFENEYRIRHEDESWRWMQNRGIAVRGAEGQVRRMVGSISDITESRAKDPITGLLTRTAFLNALDWRMRNVDALERTYAVLLVDLDDFKRFNNSFGQHDGNCILVELGRRFQETLKGSGGNAVARLAGDEFAILVGDLAGEDDALTFANCLEHLLHESVPCGHHDVTVSASVGIVMGYPSYTKAEHLLHDADLAMHEAKLRGKKQSVLFNESQRARVLAKVSLESELRGALERNELVLHYQPQVELSTRRIAGFESLIRWKHPEHGLLAPGCFIPMAEESDLILEIGRFTLQESVRQLSIWRMAGLVDRRVTIAVNLSARQFSDKRLVESVRNKLIVHDLPSANVELEVTEGVLIHDADAALRILQGLKDLGVSLALDDFGVGYSSLSYLQRFPFDTLKIDRSFTDGLGASTDTTAIVEAVLAVGRALELTTIAEGIETPDQARRVQALDCFYGQGFLFSKPLDPCAMQEHLRNLKAIDTRVEDVHSVPRPQELLNLLSIGRQ